MRWRCSALFDDVASARITFYRITPHASSPHHLITSTFSSWSMMRYAVLDGTGNLGAMYDGPQGPEEEGGREGAQEREREI